MANKLELTWYGKDAPIRIEPRLLIENRELSNTENDPDTENMLIHGDNLLALKALLPKYEGKVKCIYIDPPFNTGQAFENYDDNLEMSIWLNLMKKRLELLRCLLSKDGTIFAHIDDAYLPYLTLLMDEVFYRKNRLYLVTFKQGSATGHKAINPGIVTTTNFVLIYSKNKTEWNPNRVYTKRSRDDRYGKFIKNIDDDYKKWQFCTLMEAFAESINQDISEARKIAKMSPDLLDEFVIEHANAVVQPAKPDISNVGKDVKEIVLKSKEKVDEIFYLHREDASDMYFMGGKRILFYKDKLKIIDGELVTAEPLTSLWDDILSNNLHNEGGVKFPKAKKPEHLIKRVIELCTNEGDIVLDSFLGSGTTASVAHKMNRKWIGVEMGEQAYSHCKPRMDALIKGDDKSGITKIVNWNGGGGYRFYELAPTLVMEDAFGEPVINPTYDANMLSAAVALHEGFTYEPDENSFWKQARGNEKSYLFVTTRHLDEKYVDSIKNDMSDDEYLIIACKSYESGIEKAYSNITIKKIPQMLLEKCEFDKTYDLNIICPPTYEDEEESEDE